MRGSFNGRDLLTWRHWSHVGYSSDQFPTICAVRKSCKYLYGPSKRRMSSRYKQMPKQQQQKVPYRAYLRRPVQIARKYSEHSSSRRWGNSAPIPHLQACAELKDELY